MTDYTARNVLLKDANGNYLIPYTEKADLSLSNLNASGKAYVAIKGYDSTATYSLNEVVMTIVSGSVLFYKSLANNNSSALSDTTKWEAVSFGGGSPAWGNITGTLSNQTDLQNVLDGKAPLNSPAFTGTPKAPTAAATVNNTQIATTAYVVAHRCTTAATTTSSASIYKPAIVVENYRSGNNWYRKWSDGWIEQGGYAYISAGINITVNLNKAFSRTDYQVLLTAVSDGNLSQLYPYSNFANKTTSSFKVQFYTNNGFYWKAYGY